MKDLEIKQEEEDPVVTKRELQGFYSFGVATNPFAGVGLAVFFPILLESLAAAGGSYEVSNHTLPCNYTAKDYKCDVMLGPNSYVSLNSIVFYAIVISVALQLVTYISFGCLADHGSYRKKLMYAFSYATAISGMCLLLVLNNSLWWISYILFILSGVTFGSSYVYYYAHVPLLTRSSEDVIKARRTG
jgi:UMF1 family MFS transporter